jgi:membrane protein DedA with SNARE-associated domain
MDQLTAIFNWATSVIGSLTALVTDTPITYLVIFASAAIDPVFPVIPSEAVITTAAVLAGQGKLTVAWIILAAALGAFVGDNITYWIGRAAGRPLIERVLRGNTRQLEAIEEQFATRGGTFVIVGRFVPGGRTAVGIGAGVLHFPWPQYLAYEALAAGVWALQAALPGFIGGSLIQDEPWLALVIGFGLSALVAGGAALFQRRRNRLRALEAPVKPAVIGFGTANARVETSAEAEAELVHDVEGRNRTPS